MPANFLVVNQHGDNRGDEAALRGMVAALSARVPGCTIRVLHQFNAAGSQVEVPNVEYLPLRVPPTEALRLVAWAGGRRLGVDARRVLGPQGRHIADAYADADVVISAPGGPYFGDIYADHEAVHWFYVWLARVHGAPTALYQPSAGPFENRLLRPLRRRGFRWFDETSVREPVSADHVEALTGCRPRVGSDSALHEDIAPLDPTPWIHDIRADATGLVTATFRDPGPARREIHDRAVAEALVRVSETGRAVLLLPQLHGAKHRDQPYLERLAAAARARGAAVGAAPDTLDSREQRGLVAASDFVLAGRYHPLVFAVSAGVPAVVVPYEHKARSFARSAGLGEFVVELDELDDHVLAKRTDELIGRLGDARAIVARHSPALRRAAEETADRVVGLAGERRGEQPCTS